MLQHVTMGRRDATPPPPQETPAPEAIDTAPDYRAYREFRLRDGASVFIPVSDDNIPTD